jgi:hypothetical protein
MTRKVAIGIPARNEAERISGCLRAVAASAASAGVRARVVVFANNCADDTARRVRDLVVGPAVAITVTEADLPSGRAHAGWARRLALDAAADGMDDIADLLLSTDADTLVTETWLARNLAWIDHGYDAVAGVARLSPADLKALPPSHRSRLALLRQYERAIDYLMAARDRVEPWPRHFYEGGASIALRLGMYRRIGGAPTPEVGEDKALFAAVRAQGGHVRHPLDVKVVTSARLEGRARGGASDTLAVWGRLGEDDPIPGVETIAERLGLKGAACETLTFRSLPDEIRRARIIASSVRRSGPLAEAG